MAAPTIPPTRPIRSRLTGAGLTVGKQPSRAPRGLADRLWLTGAGVAVERLPSPALREPADRLRYKGSGSFIEADARVLSIHAPGACGDRTAAYVVTAFTDRPAERDRRFVGRLTSGKGKATGPPWRPWPRYRRSTHLNGQRGWKQQPASGLIGLAGAPVPVGGPGTGGSGRRRRAPHRADPVAPPSDRIPNTCTTRSAALAPLSRRSQRRPRRYASA